MNAKYFGPELDTLIVSKFFQPAEFYPIFRSAFSVAYQKFSAHIPSHPGRPLFFAAQVFNPKFFHLGDVTRKDIRNYSIIQELSNPSNELLHEWSIYCGLKYDIAFKDITLDEFWLNMADSLPHLSEIALDYIWLPASSCAVERSFSKYNTILDTNRQSLSEETLQSLNMLYFNNNLNSDSI